LPFKSIDWDGRYLKILDQTKLPNSKRYIKLITLEDIYRAIKELKIRGAPLIGVTAAYGLASLSFNMERDQLKRALKRIESARPTAVNLSWALRRMEMIIEKNPEDLPYLLVEEAERIEKEEEESCRRIGKFGAELIRDGARVLTYCNTGRLATPGIGTALGIVYTAKEEGKRIEVYVCETRPLLQGARLTAFELKEEGIPFTLITDNMIATVMNKIDVVLVGADRIARNYDVANKIGTHTIAIVAKHFGVPFYVAAPLSTFDFSKETGSQIEIEYRDSREVREVYGTKISPEGIDVLNPAFDITPKELITGIITEEGIIRP